MAEAVLLAVLIALALTIALTGHAGPMLSDFSVAFLVVTAISFLASPVSARLPLDAGVAMSGHHGGKGLALTSD